MKAPYTLSHTMPAGEATRRVLLFLLDEIERSEPGVRAGDDPECLHGLRVAVRRTRSVLGQLKRLFPAERLAPFRDDFRWLGHATGTLRDLDVYLLRLDAYRAEQPSPASDDLGPFAALLQEHQQAEHARLVALLDTPRYAALLRTWRHALTASDLMEHMPEAHQPARRIVSRRIGRLYRRARRKARACLKGDAPTETLHDLRITCKKLRYLMELFGPLYPHRVLRSPLNALRRLQDRLGDARDLDVQRRRLHAAAHAISAGPTASADTLLAMGRFDAHLERTSHEASAALTKLLAAFTRKKRRFQFERLVKLR